MSELSKRVRVVYSHITHIPSPRTPHCSSNEEVLRASKYCSGLANYLNMIAVPDSEYSYSTDTSDIPGHEIGHYLGPDI